MIRTKILACSIVATLSLQSLLAQQAQAQTKAKRTVSQIYSTLTSEFQKRYPGNVRVHLNDIWSYRTDPIISPNKVTRFLVLASGGLFVFDDSLTTILKTIDFISDGDYTYKITKVWKDTLTIRGESGKKGLDPIEKNYKLNLAMLLSQSDSAQVRKDHSPTECSQIIATLRQRFQKDHPGNIRVQLEDVRAYQADPMYLGMPANRFLVTARGFYYDTTGHYQHELLGIFVFDDSLTTILRTIDYINYAQKYAFRIFRVWKDTLTVQGDVIDFNSQPIQRRYKLYFWEKYK